MANNIVGYSKNYFTIYKVQEALAITDPDLRSPRYHTIIFIETDEEGNGWLHHVTGDLVTGMTYERRKSHRLELSESFQAKQLMGKVKQEDLLRVHEICGQQPAPGRQKAFNPRTMSTEPVKPDGGFYEDGEPRVRLRKCTELTLEQAIPALKDAGVLQAPLIKSSY